MSPETARYLLELEGDLQKLWKALESHSTADEYRRAAEGYRAKAEETRRQIREYKAELASQVKTLNEETARYVNIVSAIGYAGYFATWGFTRNVLDEDTTAFVGLMGMLSVGIFVVWEILGVFYD